MKCKVIVEKALLVVKKDSIVELDPDQYEQAKGLVLLVEESKAKTRKTKKGE